MQSQYKDTNKAKRSSKTQKQKTEQAKQKQYGRK
jgi:hypothetical protein